MQELNGNWIAAAISDHVVNSKYGVEIPNRSQWTEGAPNIELGGLVWYTDGSKLKGGVGPGIMGPKQKLSIPMGKASILLRYHTHKRFERSKNIYYER